VLASGVVLVAPVVPVAPAFVLLAPVALAPALLLEFVALAPEVPVVVRTAAEPP
jgi:hypothetical protein